MVLENCSAFEAHTIEYLYALLYVGKIANAIPPLVSYCRDISKLGKNKFWHSGAEIRSIT